MINVGPAVDVNQVLLGLVGRPPIASNTPSVLPESSAPLNARPATPNTPLNTPQQLLTDQVQVHTQALPRQPEAAANILVSLAQSALPENSGPELQSVQRWLQDYSVTNLDQPESVAQQLASSVERQDSFVMNLSSETAVPNDVSRLPAPSTFIEPQTLGSQAFEPQAFNSAGSPSFTPAPVTVPQTPGYMPPAQASMQPEFLNTSAMALPAQTAVAQATGKTPLSPNFNSAQASHVPNSMLPSLEVSEQLNSNATISEPLTAEAVLAAAHSQQLGDVSAQVAAYVSASEMAATEQVPAQAGQFVEQPLPAVLDEVPRQLLQVLKETGQSFTPVRTELPPAQSGVVMHEVEPEPKSLATFQNPQPNANGTATLSREEWISTAAFSKPSTSTAVNASPAQTNIPEQAPEMFNSTVDASEWATQAQSTPSQPSQISDAVLQALTSALREVQASLLQAAPQLEITNQSAASAPDKRLVQQELGTSNTSNAQNLTQAPMTKGQTTTEFTTSAQTQQPGIQNSRLPQALQTPQNPQSQTPQNLQQMANQSEPPIRWTGVLQETAGITPTPVQSQILEAFNAIQYSDPVSMQTLPTALTDFDSVSPQTLMPQETDFASLAPVPQSNTPSPLQPQVNAADVARSELSQARVVQTGQNLKQNLPTGPTFKPSDMLNPSIFASRISANPTANTALTNLTAAQQSNSLQSLNPQANLPTQQWSGWIPIQLHDQQVPAWVQFEWQQQGGTDPDTGQPRPEGKAIPVNLALHLSSERLGWIAFHLSWAPPELQGSMVVENASVARLASAEMQSLEKRLSTDETPRVQVKLQRKNTVVLD